jgi:hypothetical protein
MTFWMNILLHMTDSRSLFIRSILLLSQHGIHQIYDSALTDANNVSPSSLRNHFLLLLLLLLLLLCAGNTTEARWAISSNEYECRCRLPKLFISHYSTQLWYSNYNQGLNMEPSWYAHFLSHYNILKYKILYLIHFKHSYFIVKHDQLTHSMLAYLFNLCL